MDDNAKVNLEQATIQSLNTLKKVTPKGTEYWLARDLQGLLGYSQWRNLEEVIEKAKRACEMSANDPRIHFADTSKKVTLGGGSIREIKDVALTRYAAYLVAMNGDSAKPEIAAAQTYFAVQTRKQELAEQKDEDESRLALRNRVKRSNRYLAVQPREQGCRTLVPFITLDTRVCMVDSASLTSKRKREYVPTTIYWTSLAAQNWQRTSSESLKLSRSLKPSRLRGNRQPEKRTAPLAKK